MKAFNRIFILRIWNPNTSKIRQKFFMKEEVLFGSDRSCDIKIEGKTGICARLDFLNREIHYLERDRIDSIQSGELFQIDGFVFQYTERDLFKKEWRWSAAVFVTGVAIIFTFYLFRSKTIPEKKKVCSARWEQIVSGKWNSTDLFFQNLTEIKKSFQLSVKNKNWVKGRSEIETLRSILDQEASPNCIDSRLLMQWETQFSRALVLDYLRMKNAQAAADEIHRFRSQVKSDALDRLENRVLKLAQKIYFEGYRIEEESPDRGNELMEQAEQVCTLLNREPHCFKQKEKRE